MGSTFSKASRSSSRKYPTRVPPARPPPPQPHAANAAKAGQTAGPQVHPTPQASATKDESISLDAADPAFAAQLRSLGPVSSNPFASADSPFSPPPPSSPPTPDGTSANANPVPTSTTTNPSTRRPGPASTSAGAGGRRRETDLMANPALVTLAARDRLAKVAEEDGEMIGRRGFQGRRMADAATLARALTMRENRGGGVEVAGEIEKELRLKGGVVGSLGKGVVGVVR